MAGMKIGGSVRFSPRYQALLIIAPTKTLTKHDEYCEFLVVKASANGISCLQLNDLRRLALEEQKSRKASTTEGSSWLPDIRFNSAFAASSGKASR